MPQPLLMGILNVTPDSFSDGGELYRDGKLLEDRLLERALRMVEEGADLLDVGGESSGPDSHDVSVEEELRRVIPAVQLIRKHVKCRISVDTSKADVARQALDAGADIINDVTALRGDSEMAEMIARHKVPVVIMFAKDDTPRTSTENVQYDDVVATIKNFWKERMKYGMEQGILRDQFILDPGMGVFVSADPKYSLEILARLQEFEEFGLPILIGASRKGFIGDVLAKDGKRLPVSERLEGSLACAAVAVLNGASIIRVHDVKETRRVIDMVWKIDMANR